MNEDDKPDYFLADDEQDKSAETKSIDFSDSETADSEKHRPRHHRLRKVMIWTAIIGVVVLGAAFYLRYCSPYATDAVMRVYVVNVEKRGLIFKTFEAQVVSLDALGDTTQIYSHPDQFTIPTEKMAQELQTVQGQKIPVSLHYEKYYATLPWRGSSKWVVTSISR